MNKILNRIIVLLLIISLGINLVTVLRINNATEDIGRNYEKLNYIERNVGNLSEDLNKLYSKQEWVSSKSYKILEISKDYKNVKITLQGSLKELENNSSVYLLYGKVKEDSSEDIEWIKTPLNISYGLKFSKKLELSYKENYKFKILVEGPSKVKSEDLLYAFFKEELENRIFTHIFTNDSAKDIIKLNINIKNSYKGENKLKIKDIKINVYNEKDINKTIQIYSGGKLIENNDITEIVTESGNESKNEEAKDLNIEELNYNINVKKEFKTNEDVKYEVIIEDFMGEKFIKYYPIDKK